MPLNIEALIPHRPPALLVERVVRVTASEAECLGRIGDASPFAVGGTAPAVLGIELAAQTAAVFQALRGDASKPRNGYLTTIRKARFHRPTLPVGRGLIASIRATGGLGPLFLCDVEVRLQDTGEPVVTATVGIFSTTVQGADGAV